MANKRIHHQSIRDLSTHLGFGEPQHPLLGVFDVSQMSVSEEEVGNRLSSDMYCIALKDGSCGLDYGRNHYDFDEGVVLCTAPQQMITLTHAYGKNELNGWLLYFHPDLIRNQPLGRKIEEYNFFSYEVYEALHLSSQEQEIFLNCIRMIQVEIGQRIDQHSQKVLVANIELLLNYCTRFYERQ
ncbi:MAG: AraC family transcriptional regulator, partial [Bacteroidota bacterium]